MTTITNQTIAERASHDVGLAAQDVTTPATGDWFSMKGVNRVAAVVVTNALEVGDEVTVQLRRAEDDAGEGADDLGDAVVFTATAAGAQVIIAEAKASDLGGDFTHVAVQVGGVPDDANDIEASAVLIRADESYRP